MLKSKFAIVLMRPTVSDEPPATNCDTMRRELLGQSCATAGERNEDNCAE